MELLADKFDQVIFVRSNQARSAPLSAAASWCLPCSSSFLGCRAADQKEKKRKEKNTLFSDHNGSLLRRQAGAMTIGHSPKGKEKTST